MVGDSGSQKWWPKVATEKGAKEKRTREMTVRWQQKKVRKRSARER